MQDEFQNIVINIPNLQKNIRGIVQKQIKKESKLAYMFNGGLGSPVGSIKLVFVVVYVLSWK